GDLTFQLTETFPEAYRQIQDEFNSTIARLGETILALSDAARDISQASGEISTGTSDLSQRTEEQAASLEEMTASLEEISTIVKSTAANAKEATGSVNKVVELAARNGHVVDDAVKAMARIETSSREIGDIIGVIDEIARQTNL